MSPAILADVEQTLLADERRTLAALHDALGRLDAPADSIAALARSIEQLDELFLVVIVGEFNSGKSAFINALLGSRVLKEGVTPTTAQVNVLQYGIEPARHRAQPASARHHAPLSTSCARSTSSTPRHQRRDPRARGDHRRVRAAVRPRAVRHLGRPPVHRERAAFLDASGSGARRS